MDQPDFAASKAQAGIRCLSDKLARAGWRGSAAEFQEEDGRDLWRPGKLSTERGASAGRLDRLPKFGHGGIVDADRFQTLERAADIVATRAACARCIEDHRGFVSERDAAAQ